MQQGRNFINDSRIIPYCVSRTLLPAKELLIVIRSVGDMHNTKKRSIYNAKLSVWTEERYSLSSDLGSNIRLRPSEDVSGFRLTMWRVTPAQHILAVVALSSAEQRLCFPLVFAGTGTALDRVPHAQYFDANPPYTDWTWPPRSRVHETTTPAFI
eukprot:52094-Amphidinium_carterae.1